MSDTITKTVAIKLTADGKAFAVEMTGDAAAVDKLQKTIVTLEVELDRLQKKLANSTGSDALQKKVQELEQELGRLQKKLDDAGKGNSPIKKLGDDAQKTAQQMRQIAPQVTDIVTQLSGGASPMQVLIQQGGQLKDVFGGVGPAVRAVGGYIGSLVTPTNLAIAAAGALAFAWYKGHEESAALTREIVLSGNAAGMTAGGYYQMASGLSAIGAGKSAALEALVAIAQGGRVAEESLQRFAAIALQLDRLVGKPIEETAREFQALAEQPVQASEKINRAYNYLTASQYLYIQGLEQAGRHTQAAQVAQEAFAASMEERMPKLRENLGTIERGWNFIKDAIKGAGNALLEIGRDQTKQQQAALLEAQIRLGQMPYDSRIGNGDAIRNVEANKQALALIREQIAAEKEAAKAAGAKANLEEVAQRWAAQGVTVMRSGAKLQAEINKALEEGNQLLFTGLQTDAQREAAARKLAERIRDIRKHFIDQEAQDAITSRMASLKTLGDIEALQIQENIDRVNQLYKIGALTQAEQIEKVGQLEIKQLQDDQIRLAKKIAIAKQKQNSEREVDELEQQFAVQREQIAARKRKIDQDELALVETLALERAKLIALERQAMKNADYDQAAQALRDINAEYAASLKSVVGRTQAVQDESDALVLAARLNVSLAEAVELVAIARLREKQARTNEGGEAYEAIKREIEARGQLLEKLHDREAIQKWTQSWADANKEIGDSLFDALTGRGRQARDRLQSLFENLVVRPSIMPYLQPGAAWGASTLTGASPSGSTGLNLGSAAGMANFAGFGGQAAQYTMQNGLISGFGQNMANIGSLLEAGSFSSAIGAALPYIGWAYAAYSLLKDQFKGETRSGGQYGYSFDGLSVLNARRGSTVGASGIGATFLEGPSGGDKNSDAAKVALNTTVATINAILQGVGSSVKLTQFQGGYEASDRDRGGVFAGGTFSTGITFGESGKGDNYAGTLFESTSAHSGDLQTIFQNFVTDNKQVVIQAVQALAGEIPKTLGDLVKNVDAEGLSDADAQALVDKITTIVTNVTQLGDALLQLPFEEVAGWSFDAKAALIDFMGGLQNVVNGLTAFFNDFGTEAEKQQNLAQFISRTLTAGGLSTSVDQAMSMTRDQYKALVLQAMGMGDAGAALLGALLTVEHAFDELHPVLQQTANDVSTVTSRLDTLKQQAQQLVDTAKSQLLDAYNREAGQLQGLIDQHKQYAKALRDYRSTLYVGQMSPLNATDSTIEAYAQFRQLAQAAKGGDLEAVAKLQEAGNTYLQDLQNSALTKTEYELGVAEVAAVLTTVASSQDAAATIEQQQLDAMTQQMRLLGLIHDDNLSFQQLLAAYLGFKAGQEQLLGGGSGSFDAAGNYTSPSGGTVAAGVVQQITDTSKGIAGLESAYFGQYGQYVGSGDFFDIPDAVGTWSQQQIDEWVSSHKPRASGGYSLGKIMTGEEGIEFLDLKTPGRVYTHQQTRGMFAPDNASSAVMQQMLREARQQRDDMRRGHMSMAAELAGINDRLKKFDFDGLPQDRGY